LLKKNKKIKETIKTNPEKRKIGYKKTKSTMISNKTTVGSNNPRYVKLDHICLLESYFNFSTLKNMVDNYYSKTGRVICIATICKFYKILCLPKNTTRYKEPLKTYLQFINENKHNIQWYIDNYERLEKEYYETEWIYRYKEKDKC
jgi:hypothetical protein